MDAVSLVVDPAQATKIDGLLAQFTLDPGRQTGALARGCAKALNRAAVSARVVMVRAVADELGAKQALVKHYITTIAATSWHLEARVHPLGQQGIPFRQLNASGPMPSRGKGPGISVPGQGIFPHAFWARMRTGHLGVFQRQGTARLPIKELRSAPVPIIFRRHKAAGYARASASLATNLLAELKHAVATGA